MHKEQLQLQRVKGWESTVRKSQQLQLSGGNRRRFFSPMSVAPADDDADKSSTDGATAPDGEEGGGGDVEQERDELCHEERLLPNGDFYTGQWSNGVPHGTGKYLWTDGCMYEGEWRHGRTTGRGKFSWPSGATYEGEFKASFMDGSGTYTGASGETYRGAWSMNLKHGHGRKSYANGDFYKGEWRSGLQDGHGRYIWSNGTEYVGQWRAGLMNGRGSLTWANGNRYDGGWDNGYPKGNGSFRWADGSLYVGEWTKENAEIQQKGVYYPSPTVTSTAPRDPGDTFAADIRECKISLGESMTILPSQKALHWSSIELRRAAAKATDPATRREASVDNSGAGLPPRRPNGRKHTASGISGNAGRERGFDSMSSWDSDGIALGASGREGIEELAWGNDMEQRSSTVTSTAPRDPGDTFAADIRECKISLGESMTILPSQKALHWSSIELRRAAAKATDPATRREASVDNSGAGLPPRRPNGRKHTASGISGNAGRERGFDSMSSWDSDGIALGASGREGIEELAWGNDMEQRMVVDKPLVRWPPKAPKKQGEAISKGHKNYELMLNLQLGIRHAVGKQGPAILELKASAFDPKEKVWTKFPPEGSKHTPPHQSCDFKWKDYCPLVFRMLRRMFKVDAADYMMSLCGSDALRELCSPGKSGSFFYLTHDDKYMIKTVKKAEVKVLLRMLPAYYHHICAFENTLVTKFFGLHCVKLTGSSQKKVRFVIIGSLFCSSYTIHRRFDLKGSSLGRMTSKPESEIDENTTLKDLDLNFMFRLQKSWFQEFQRQVDRDCEFLEQERIMDYSLLVGVHFRSLSEMTLPEGKSQKDLMRDGRTTPRLSRADIDHFFTDPNRWATIKLGANMPARAELTARRNDSDFQLYGEPTGESYEVILFFGIIDILQDYDISKKLEHAYKSIQYDPTSISAVDPKQYSRRFRDFVFRAFIEET